MNPTDAPARVDRPLRSPWQRNVLGVVLLLGLAIAGLIVARLVPTSWYNDPSTEANMSVVFCKKCDTQTEVAWGQSVRCRLCGNRLAVCGKCGKPLPDSAHAVRDESSQQWLCKRDFEQEQWVRETLRTLGEPEQNTPLPKTARALAVRDDYEKRVRAALGSGSPPRTVFRVLDRLEPTHEGVRQARDFFQRAVPDPSFGRTDVFRWEVDGEPYYVLRLATRSGNGWLELYDIDGTALGFARTMNECPVWLTCGTARTALFRGDADDVRRQLDAAERRLRGR